MSSKGFDSVQDAVVRMRSLVLVARTLDDVEMRLVLNSEILRSMTCSYRVAAHAVTRYRDTLWWQLDSELDRVVAALAVLQSSRDVPDRLALAQRQWQSASHNLGDLAARIQKIEQEDTGWSGRARSSKSRAVERQQIATEEFGETLRGMGRITQQGQLLMESVFTTADLHIRGNNTQLAGFVHRAPSADVGLWGLFSRSDAAVSRVRATAGFLAGHISPGAPWRTTSSELRRGVNELAAGGRLLTEDGWPRPVASA